MSNPASHIKIEKRSAERSRSKLVPALRFNGFEGMWVKNKLIDWSLVVLDGDRGSNYPSGDEFQPEGYCLFMNAKNVTKTGFSFEHKMFITKEKDGILRKGKLKREDLVLTTRGSVGHIAYYDQSVPFDNLRINSGMVLIRNENDLISSKFIYINFFTPNLIKQISTISFGSAQPQLTVKEINKFKFNIPTLPEQQKIASFLSAVDKKIQQLTKKKALLEQYKKGVMHQLFSGQLRFKAENGNPYPDWEKRKNKIQIIAGNAYSLNEYVDQGVMLIQGYNIGPGKLDLSQPYYISESNSTKHIELEHADILLGLNRPITNGKLKVCRYDLKDKGYLYQRAGKLKFDNSEIEPDFLYQYMKSISFLKKLSLELVGSDQPYIKSNLFQVIKLVFPSLPEQQKIATYLSGIDTKIENVNNQIIQTQTFKKGLLQQMFV